ncbi:ERF family protein [Flavonifractor sp. An306]|uniref:ERF family protein n=1 Tax=Flavonifractor sp. An306 TaxID=1965629 RepID=UPI00174AC110|nr:ERF family protein [Flavonifractor sp. An306]
MEADRIKTMNIFERIACITAELEPLEKDLIVGNGDKSYKAASEGSVLAAIKPKEEKYRVMSYATARQQTSMILEKEYTWNGERRTVKLTKVDVTETYRFVNIDNPEEYIETVAFGTGIDTYDKAPGKAMTYADKYALMKMYKMSTGAANDPDSCASPEPDFIPLLADTPSPDNPLDFSARPAHVSSAPAGAAPTEQAPANAAPAGAEKGENGGQPAEMTLEQARALILPIGEYKGKSMGEVYAINPGLIGFYAGERFKSERNPALKTAAKVILDNMPGK